MLNAMNALFNSLLLLFTLIFILINLYAITTHKAQGSSINYIFPDIADMRPCPDLQKILYTALTRARIQAFIPQ